MRQLTSIPFHCSQTDDPDDPDDQTAKATNHARSSFASGVPRPTSGRARHGKGLRAGVRDVRELESKVFGARGESGVQEAQHLAPTHHRGHLPLNLPGLDALVLPQLLRRFSSHRRREEESPQGLRSNAWSSEG